MKNKIEERYHHSNFAFRIISLMHDNPLIPIFRNPCRLLEAAGLKSGQKVLEVGCGPGFFTIPAAKIVGEEGSIYAVDVHPLAIKKVKEKVEREGIKNVNPILVNASDTGLPDQSIDLAFIFGLRYIAGGMENMISEMYRILKPEGVLSFEKTRGSEKKLISDVEREGFIYSGRNARIFLFAKCQGDGSSSVRGTVLLTIKNVKRKQRKCEVVKPDPENFFSFFTRYYILDTFLSIDFYQSLL